MNTRLERAAYAENIVAEALERQKWHILARNFRHIGFELDIVARKGDTLVTVEVKYRRSLDGRAFERLLPRRKYDALQRGLLHYVRRHKVQAKTLRVDLALLLEERACPPALRYWAGVTREACQ